MPKEKNLIQAEFFLPSFDSLEGVIKESFERFLDGAPIKTVVRFVDDGSVTRAVTFYLSVDRMAKAFSQYYFEKQPSIGVLKEAYLYVIKSVLDLCVSVLHEKRVSFMAAKFEQAVRAKQDIGVETDTHRFRKARRDELHELIESARAARDVWVCVFKPNQLLADSNEFAVEMMF